MPEFRGLGDRGAPQRMTPDVQPDALSELADDAQHGAGLQVMIALPADPSGQRQKQRPSSGSAAMLQVASIASPPRRAVGTSERDRYAGIGRHEGLDLGYGTRRKFARTISQGVS